MILEIILKKRDELLPVFIEVKDPLDVYNQLGQEWIMLYPLNINWDLDLMNSFSENKGDVLMIRPNSIEIIQTKHINHEKDESSKEDG